MISMRLEVLIVYLQILGGVMVVALAGAGFYFGTFFPSDLIAPGRTSAEKNQGRSPTTSTSETHVSIQKEGMPWETGATEGKYRYHPGGNRNAEPKDAPSAVNVVVVPNVNLPKVCYLAMAETIFEMNIIVARVDKVATDLLTEQ